MYRYHYFTPEEKDSFITPRERETHLGETMDCGLSSEGEKVKLENSRAKFVLLCLPEDVGVRANGGIGGTGTNWQSFLKSFLNIQDTESLSGNNFLLHGCLHISPSPVADTNATIEELRRQTAEVDDLVFPLIKNIIATGKIPIIIGGGHNNAYPILKGTSLALGHPVNAINTDAHADFRAIEGRHSGNGFSYAFTEGYLKNYFVLGLHEAYNSKGMVDDMRSSKHINFIFWEDIFLRHKTNWEAAIQKGLIHVSENPFGVELDTDSIAKVLTSAMTPVGISPREAMEVLHYCGQKKNAVYLHLPEAIYKRKDGLQNPLAGKLLNYLVQAFAKGVLER